MHYHFPKQCSCGIPSIWINRLVLCSVHIRTGLNKIKDIFKVFIVQIPDLDLKPRRKTENLITLWNAKGLFIENVLLQGKIFHIFKEVKVENLLATNYVGIAWILAGRCILSRKVGRRWGRVGMLCRPREITREIFLELQKKIAHGVL